MTIIARLLPMPIMSLAVLLLWISLAPAPTVGHILLGLLLGWSIPWLTQSFWPDRPRVRRPLAGILLGIRVVGDILVANWQVARLVLGPLESLRPAFIEVPIDIDDPFVATLLGSIVSLTPGTVSIEIERQRRVLLVHALDVPDPAETVATIKSRYERPLKEIFGC